MTTTSPTPPASSPLSRRHDVDWLRVIALALLIVYHVVVSFQSWAPSIAFPRNDTTLPWLWIPMAMINVWRIPILFLISGMGVRFAMERRDWKQLLADRTLRILVPFVFCTYILGIALGIATEHLGWSADFGLQFGHLWFLANIYVYFLCLLPTMVFLKRRPDNGLFRLVARIAAWPMGLLLMALPLMLQAELVHPRYFVLYAATLHGYLLGLICFFLGFLFVSLQDAFWPAVARIRRVALILALSLYLVRLAAFRLQSEISWLVALECMSWMLALLGYASVHFNRPSRALTYCSRAVYPVYIVHLPVQFILAHFLLPVALPALLKFALLLVGTFGISLLLYEFVLRRIRWIRPLFGMKLDQP
jgi:peptidoglycan/LPS O-acetylase OafA/YrhL